VRAVRAYGCALVVVLAACRTQPAAPSVEKSAEGARAAAPARDASPRSMKELPTTDHTIAVGNLQAQIADYEKRLAKAPNGPAILKALVGLYAMRAQFFSRLDDYDRAGALAERLVKVAPADGEAWAARAGCRASMHRFQDALADLDEAERRGVRNDELAGARASIYQALGRYGDAAKIRERKAREWPTLASLGALASLRAEEGNTDEAERLFIEAQDKFSDVSPFSLAWLYLQEGLMWQKAGYLSRARELFEAAHERLPEYAPVTSHLASVEAVTGSRDRAIALVRPLVDGSDDPEYAGQLASLLADGGDKAEAAALRARAADRYRQLIAQHPAAFADHAARFWLGPGGDAKQALALARLNLDARKTSESYELVIDAALAAGTTKIACDAAERALALPKPSPPLRLAAARAADTCARVN